jgi:serine/threonine protein kinase
MNASGTRIGERYEMIRLLGEGSFGHTYLARDHQLSRDVAIKVLDAHGRTDEKAYELFRREADVLRAVRHHGIPEVYETLHAEWSGKPAAFLVMEYVEGESLQQVIDAKRALDPGQAVHLFLELLGVLDYLHSRVPPILHRDIKPSNIILRPNGFPTVVDFGSVRRVFLSPEESGSTIAGTYGYMPYEQYMGQASPSSDLYALAATFLHLLTGRAPRDFMNDEGRIQVPDPLPGEERLGMVIARLLRPSPAERFARARDVRDALVNPSASPAAVATRPRSSLNRSAASLQAGGLLADMPPAPRPLTGPTKELLERASPGTLRMMTGSEKDMQGWGAVEIATLVFFGLVTVGIMPLVFYSMARSRRRLLRHFLQHGTPGTAEILNITTESTAFGEKLARVNYEFRINGQLYRDSDMVLPIIAHRLQPGDNVPILYLPERNYDSVIIAT